MLNNNFYVSFICAASNIFLWYKTDIKHLLYMGKNQMIKNERIKVNDTDHTLIIKDVQPDDEDNYGCRVLPHGVEMIAKLQVIPLNGGALEKPSAHIYATDGRDISERSFTFRQGERIEILCKGRPETTNVKWFIGGNRVAPSDNVQIDGNRLIIISANRDHNRLFSCLIEGADGNNVGSTTVTINVHCK